MAELALGHSCELLHAHCQCELYHWVELLDRFDGLLAEAGQAVEGMSWLLVCDRPERAPLKALLLAVLNFTALLIEYSFSRHLYSSIEVWRELRGIQGVLWAAWGQQETLLYGIQLFPSLLTSRPQPLPGRLGGGRMAVPQKVLCRLEF